MYQFEKNADQYARIRAKITYPDALYERLSSLCPKHDSALDIACGSGASSIRLTNYFKEVSGVDLGENLIQHAKQSYPEINFYVSKIEEFNTNERYDLITSATSFYWMDRELVTKKVAAWLNPGGVFCAYQYDFPVVYGPLQDFITGELKEKWQAHKDKRLAQGNNTLEILQASNVFARTESFVQANVIELTATDIAHFFLSTSFVTKFIEESADADYPEWFINKCQEIGGRGLVKVAYNVSAYLGQV
jgi:predicted TPR repeat methyltransferase